jgi:hypothetical protein
MNGKNDSSSPISHLGLCIISLIGQMWAVGFLNVMASFLSSIVVIEHCESVAQLLR